MGLELYVAPVMGLGFAIHFGRPLLELCIGPFVIRIGDLDELEED